MNLARAALLAAAGLAVATQAKAQTTIVWGTALGAGPHTWGTTTNWTGGNVPDTSTEIADLRKDWTAAATINLSANTTINGLLFDDTGASGDVQVTIASNTLALAGTSPSISAVGQLNIGSILAGTGGFAKAGSGTLRLTNTGNTFSGAIAVNAGTLWLDRSWTAGNATTGVANYTVTNATLSLVQTTGTNYVAGRSFGLGAAGSSLTMSGGTLNLGATTGATYQLIASGATFTLSGTNTIAQSSGSYAQRPDVLATIVGSGILNLNRANAATSSQRFLAIKGDMSGYTGDVVIGTSNVTDNKVIIGHSTGWGSGALTLTGSGSNLQIGDEIATVINAAWTGGTLGFRSGTISTGGLITLGAGSRLNLQNVNAADAVLLEARGGMAIGSATVGLNGTAGASFYTPYTDTTWAFNPTTTASAVSGNIRLDFSGVTFDVAEAITGTDAVVSGVISGTNSLRKIGAGALALTGANTSSGGFSIEAGSINLGNGGANGSLGTGTVTLASGATLNYSRTGDFTLNNAVAGAGAWNKAQSGIVTQAGSAAAFTGTLSVNAGSLVYTAAADLGYTTANVASGANLTIAAGHTVGAGRTLNLRGSSANDATASDFTGNLSLAGGALSVGGAGTVGTALVTGNLSVANASEVRFDLGSAATVGAGSSDLLRVVGDISFGAGASFVISGLPLASDTYRLATYTGALTGFDNLAVGYLSATRSTFTKIHNEADKAIDVAIGYAPAALLWSGAAATWDESTQSFTNLGTAAADRFYASDSVSFDDTGAANAAVTLVGNLYSGAVAFSGSTDYTLSGSGTLTLTSLAKSGASTVTLGAGVTSSSGVTVSAGTLRLATGASLTGGATVAGGTLRLETGSTYTGTLSVASGARLAVADLTGLSRATTTVDGGRLEIEALSGAFNQAFTVGASGATLAVTGVAANLTRDTAVADGANLTLEVTRADGKLTLPTAWTSTGTVTKTGAGILAVTQNLSPSSWTVSEGILSFGENSAAGSTGSTVSVAAGATVRFSRATNPGAQSSGVISGAGDVEFVGINDGVAGANGQYTVATANTYSGVTRLTGARVSTSNASQFGTSVLDISRTGQFYVSTAGLTFANDMVLRGGGWADNAGTGVFGSVRFDAAGTLTGTITLAGSDVRISSNGLTISGVIRDDATGGRGFNLGNPDNATAGGTLTLTGANTFSGPVRVNRGTLSVASLNSVVGGQASSNLGAPATVEAGTISLGLNTLAGTLTYTGAGETTDRVLNLAGTTGGATVNNNGGGTLRLTSGLTVTGDGAKTLTLAGVGSFILDGSLADFSATSTTALTKTGAGTLTLNAASTFSGGFSLGSGGTLLVGNDQALGTGTANLGNGGAATVRSTDATARTLANAITYSNDLTFGGAGTGNLTFTGSVNLGGSAKTATIDNAVTEFSGVLSRTAANTLTKAGEGTLILSGENTFFAGSSVVVNAGTLQVGKGATSGSLGPATLQNNAVTRFERSDNVTFSQVISGTGTLVQAGSGDLILAAANTYTGLTQVNAGRLVLGTGGSLAANATVDLRGGGLAFAGGQTWASGQTLRINGAGAVGSATVGNLRVGGGTFAFDIASLASLDRLTVAAGSTLEIESATFAINALGGSLAAGTYDLIDYAGATFTDSSLAGPLSGITLQGIASTGSRQLVSLANAADKISLVVSGSTASLTWTNAAGDGVWRVRNEVTDLDDSTPGNWLASGTPGGLLTQFYQNDSVTFDGTAAGTVTLADALTAGTVTVSGAANHTFAGTGSLTAGSLAKSGTGKLTLTAGLSTTGGVTLTAGELEVATAAANATAVNVQGGILRLTSGGVSSINATGGRVIIAGVDSLGSAQLTLNGGRLEIEAATGAFESALTLGAAGGTVAVTGTGAALTRSTFTNLSGNLTLDVASATGSLAVSSVLAGAGAIIKEGAGTVTLSSANLFDGGVDIRAGTLATSAATSLGRGSVTLGAGSADATLRIGFNTVVATNVTVSASGTGVATLSGGAGGASNTEYSGLITLGRDTVIRAGSADRLTFTNVVSGAGGLVIATPETAGGRVSFIQSTALTAPTFAGDITIQDGAQLQIGVATNTNNFAIPDTASIRFEAQTSPAVVNFRLSGTGTGWAESVNALISNAPGAGHISFTNGTSGVLTIGAANGSGDYSGNISGAVSLIKSGTGTQTLSGATAHTGSTTVTGGTLVLAHASALAGSTLTTSATGTLVFDASVAGGAFNLGGLAGSADLALLNNAPSPAALALSVGANNADTTFSGVLSGPGSLTKVGTGTLTLSAANTFTGGVTVGSNNTGTNDPSLSISHASALGSGSLRVLAAAAYSATTYASAGSPFLRLTPSSLTLANNIEMPTEAGFYAIQRGTTAENASASGVAILSGVISGGAAGVVLQFDHPTAGQNTSAFQLDGANTFLGTLRVNRGRLIVNHLSALGDAATVVNLQTNSSGTDGNLVFNLAGTFANPIDVTTSGNSINTLANNVTLSGIVSGAAAFAKLGAGTLTLTGANTNSGGATVNAGTLLLGSDSAITSVTGALTVSGGVLDLGGFSHTTAASLAVNTGSAVNGTISATGNFSSSGNATITAVLTGAGTFTKTGAGTVTTLTNATYSGASTVNSGTLLLAGSNVLGGAATAAAGGTLRFSGTNSVGNLNANGAGAAITLDSGATVTAAALGTGSATGSSWTVSSGATLNATNFNNAWNPTSFVVDGTLNLSSTAANAFNHATNAAMVIGGTGTINVAGGFTNANAGSSNPLFNVARFNLGGGATGIAITRSVGTIRLGTSTIGIFGQNWATAANASMQLVEENVGTTFDTLDSVDGVTARTMTLAAALSGAGKLNKVNAGTLVLGVANTYTGATSVTGGTLRFAAGGLAATSAITVNGATLEWAASNTDDLSPRLALGALGATLDIGANNVAFAGSLAAAGNLTKAGSGGLTLGAAGSVAGSVSVQAGKLVLGDSASVGSAAIALAADTTLTLGFTPASALTFANTVTGSGSLEVATTSETNLVTLANIAGFNGTLRLVSGYLDNAGYTGSLTYVGGKLTDASALAGTLIVEGRYAANQGLPADVLLRPSGVLDFAGVTGAPLASTVRYAGGSLDNAAAYTGTLDVQVSGLALATGSLGSGTVRLGTGLSATVGANFANDIRLEGTASLTNDLSNFAATVILGNLAAYNLGTNPDFVRTAAFRLTSGSRLRGQGVTGDLTVGSGGILAPGNSPGTVTVDGNMILQSGGILEFEAVSALGLVGAPVPGTDYDTLVVTGELNLAALSSANRFTLDLMSLADAANAGALADFDSAAEYQFTLIEYGTLDLGANAALGTDLSSLFAIDTTAFLDQGGLEVAAGWSVINDNATSSIVLTYAPIPEPSTYGLALGALALAAAAVRRRARRSSGAEAQN